MLHPPRASQVPSNAKNTFHEKYTMVTQPKGNKSSVHQFETLEIHPEVLVQFCLENHCCYRNPNIFPWSIRSVWYHHFGLNIQEIASTENEHLLWQIMNVVKFWNLKKHIGKLFPHPVEVFCTLLETPKCHIMQTHINVANLSFAR